MNHYHLLLIGLCVGISVTTFSAHATGPSCGTHWTGWVNEAHPTTNPCPKNCVRGERRNERTYKRGGKTQYDVQYQCYFSSENALTPSTPAEPELSVVPTNAYPLLKSSPGEPGAERGAWLDRYDPFTNRPAPSGAWQAQMRALAKILRESPALADLRGYYPKLSVAVDEKAQPVAQASLLISMWWPYAVAAEPGISTPEKKHLIMDKYADSGPGGYYAFINELPIPRSGVSLNSADWMNDDAGRFFPLTPVDRTIAGFPVQAGYLFITAPGKAPLFVPVSQERALRGIIRLMQAQIQNTGETHDMVNEQLALYNSPEMKKFRRQAIDEAVAREKDPKRAAAARAKAEKDDLEQERQIREMAGAPSSENPIAMAAKDTIATMGSRLATMSEAQRRAPAYMKNAPESSPLGVEVVAAGAKDAVPLMAFNPQFFDRRLPPHAMQLITMPVQSYFDLHDRGITAEKLSLQERVSLAIAEQTDWRKAAALLK